jgi:hypothetical protein
MGTIDRDDALSSVIARSEATKQSSLSFCRKMDCFASLAMTGVDGNASDLEHHQ